MFYNNRSLLNPQRKIATSRMQKAHIYTHKNVRYTMSWLRLQHPWEFFKDTLTAGQALAWRELDHQVPQGKVDACASRRQPSPRIPLSLRKTDRGRADSETGEEHRPRTSPQPPWAPAAVRASTSQDRRGHRHRKVTGEMGDFT